MMCLTTLHVQVPVSVLQREQGHQVVVYVAADITNVANGPC